MQQKLIDITARNELASLSRRVSEVVVLIRDFRLQRRIAARTGWLLRTELPDNSWRSLVEAYALRGVAAGTIVKLEKLLPERQ